MRIELINSGSASAMKRHYQRLLETGWGAMLNKETRTIASEFNPEWDVEETRYELILNNSEIDSELLFDLSDALKQELVIYKEGGKPVIEIYDDWRE